MNKEDKTLVLKPELAIIKLFLVYEHWNNYAHLVQVDLFSQRELQLVYRCLNNHHLVNEGVDLSTVDLSLLVYANNPIGKDKEYYDLLFTNLNSIEVSKESCLSYLVSLKRNKILRDLALASYEVSEGKGKQETVDDLVKVYSELESNQKQEENQTEFVSTSLQELSDLAVSLPGLKWRLKALNQSLGPLRKGDLGMVFARPEVGKTTFLASEISLFLQQLTPENPCLWINNEEQGYKVVMRIIQAYFGLPMSKIYENIGYYDKKFQEEAGNKLKFLDSATVSRTQVEQLCKQHNPGLIVFDQIDKIKGFVGEQEHLRLGTIYNWTRELAKEYAPVINICQADGTAEGVRYLTMQHVSGSKTSKQAEADWILGIGAVHDPGWETVRFLNISKNKLHGDKDTDPKLRHGKMEVLIQPEIARYKDIP